MEIISVEDLAINEIKIIKFGRFADDRGYFTETFRKSDFFGHPKLQFLKGVEFVQVNESFSKKGTVRGLHFQWNPYMGKLVRTISGGMIDLALDIRRDSPTFSKIIAYDMPVDETSKASQWIWVPSGFAHGTFFTQDSLVEYYCTGEYNPLSEAGISPLATDLDWSLCDQKLKTIFEEVVTKTKLISEKDRDGFSLAQWSKDPLSANFVYQKESFS